MHLNKIITRENNPWTLSTVYNIFIPLFCSVSGPSIHSLNLEYHPTECKHKSNPSRFNEQPEMPVGHKGTNNVSRFIVWYSLLWLMGLGPSLIQLCLIQVLPVKFQDVTVLSLFHYNISNTSWVPYFFYVHKCTCRVLGGFKGDACIKV